MKKQCIVFHPNYPYYSVCADVMLINPPGVVGEHKHTITPNKIIHNRNNPKPNGDASDLKTISIGNYRFIGGSPFFLRYSSVLIS